MSLTTTRYRCSVAVGLTGFPSATNQPFGFVDRFTCPLGDTCSWGVCDEQNREPGALREQPCTEKKSIVKRVRGRVARALDIRQRQPLARACPPTPTFGSSVSSVNSYRPFLPTVHYDARRNCTTPYSGAYSANPGDPSAGLRHAPSLRSSFHS